MKTLYVELLSSKKDENKDNCILDKRAANVLNNVSLLNFTHLGSERRANKNFE